MQAKKIVLTVLKLAFSAVVVGYLAVQAARDESFRELLAGPKNWPVLLLALPICLAAVTLTVLRWHLLVHALRLEFSVWETLRAGFLAYLVNLLPFGMVGGDSLKAVMLIHRNMRRKTEAVATVLVDRALGLYGLLLLAAIASLFLPVEQLSKLADADRLSIVRLCWIIQLATLASLIGLVVMLIPGVTQSRLWDVLEHIPLFGPVLHKLVGAMRAFRRRLDLLLAGIGVSLVIHSLYITSVVLMTLSIGIAPEYRPCVGSIFIIVPPAMMAGALPIGFYEVAIKLMFRAASPPGAPPNMGLLIALAYRIIQVCIATIGVGYWLAGRSEVRELIHAAEDEPPSGELNGGEPVAAGRA